MNPISSAIEEDPSGCNNLTKISGIQKLPDEILLQVFALLTVKEITQLSLVCRRWEELARDPSLYRKLEFKENQPSTRMAVKLIKMAPQLVFLSMKERDDADEILRHVGTKTSRLKVLRLFTCSGSPECFDISPKYLKNALMYCTQVREIQMRSGVWKHSETCRIIVEFCQDIEILSAKRIKNDDLAAVFDKFRHSLKILKIYDCTYIDESLLALASCSNLTTLLLFAAFNISKESLSAIGDMPNLMDLEIRFGKRMTQAYWMCMFQKAMMKRLTRLALHLCREVDDDVLRAIMKNSKVLKTLDSSSEFVDTDLTVEDVKQLTSHLNLDKLDIDTHGRHISFSNGVYMSEFKPN